MIDFTGNSSSSAYDPSGGQLKLILIYKVY
eukprot:COSAG02_NODE_52046_length_310_cov_0.943128_1_plen_29_part_10